MMKPVILVALGVTMSLAGSLTACGSGGSGEAASSATSAASSASDTASSSPSSAPSSSATTSSADGEKSYSMADVEKHNTTESCWAVIDGSVVDLTNWIGEHPGGSDKIEPLCGTDATAKFTGQHGTASLPNEKRKSFIIGTLAG